MNHKNGSKLMLNSNAENDKKHSKSFVTFMIKFLSKIRSLKLLPYFRIEVKFIREIAANDTNYLNQKVKNDTIVNKIAVIKKCFTGDEYRKFIDEKNILMRESLNPNEMPNLMYEKGIFEPLINQKGDEIYKEDNYETTGKQGADKLKWDNMQFTEKAYENILNLIEDLIHESKKIARNKIHEIVLGEDVKEAVEHLSDRKFRKPIPSYQIWITCAIFALCLRIIFDCLIEQKYSKLILHIAALLLLICITLLISFSRKS